MRVSNRLRLALAAGSTSTFLFTAGCIDIVGADLGRYVEREDKHFSTTAKPEVALSTFDGSIEIRPWDRSEVQVIIEKRGSDKSAVSAIEVHAEQSGDRVTVEVKAPKRSYGLTFGLARSAKLIVSLCQREVAMGRSTSRGSRADWSCAPATAIFTRARCPGTSSRKPATAASRSTARSPACMRGPETAP
jgi:hypothetical protein